MFKIEKRSHSTENHGARQCEDTAGKMCAIANSLGYDVWLLIGLNIMKVYSDFEE